MKFVSVLGWLVLGFCLGTMLSRAISGPYPMPGHAYAERHAHADRKAVAHPLASEIDSGSSSQE